MSRMQSITRRSFVSAVHLAAGAATAFGQANSDSPEASEGSYGVYILIAVIIAAGSAAAYLYLKSKRIVETTTQKLENRYSGYYGSDSSNMDRVDADKELEWLRVAKKDSKKASKKKKEVPAPVVTAYEPADDEAPAAEAATHYAQPIDTREFQEKMRRGQYAQLPINSFGDIKAPRPYKPLELSTDRSLLSAIDQVNQDHDEEEAVRELAIRVLATFRTRNSVEALSQTALYDLSANLRSKAVTVLAEFDHESVFETILLACADPTREVRAAAARGLFRLTFDRADAWTRIIESNDSYRMSQAARAAEEAGIVSKSFDRLIHEDLKIAYEAFALTSMVIKAGELTDVMEAVRSHKDERVKFALLHVLKVAHDERAGAELDKLRMQESLPTDVAERAREAVEACQSVTA